MLGLVGELAGRYSALERRRDLLFAAAVMLLAVFALSVMLLAFPDQREQLTSSTVAHAALTRLQVGMTRAEVEGQLADIQHQQEATPCGDLFIFGSQNPSSTQILEVTYSQVDGTERVADARLLQRRDLSGYGECTSPDPSGG